MRAEEKALAPDGGGSGDDCDGCDKGVGGESWLWRMRSWQ